jgi:hypothetical protein
MAATAHLTLVAPDNEKFTVRSAPARLPRRKPNAEYRSREHLTEREVERLIEAMKGNRWGHRDATMVLVGMAYVPPSWVTFVGIRSTSNTPSCTSAESNRAVRRRTH